MVECVLRTGTVECVLRSGTGGVLRFYGQCSRSRQSGGIKDVSECLKIFPLSQ